MVLKEEHIALRQISVVPFIPAPLDDMAECKVSGATVLRTIKHNVTEWRDAAREYAQTVEPTHWYGRVDGYNKVLELIECLERGSK